MADGTVVALGEEEAVVAWAFAGVAVRAATDPGDVVAAWRALGPDVALVILTGWAAAALEGEPLGDRLVTVIPP